MRTRRTLNGTGLTRREWPVLFGIVPVAAGRAAQMVATPEPAATTTLSKAVADVKQVSDRLSKLEVAINVEPAFTFKA